MEKVPMTLDGHAKMMDEIKQLKTVERPRLIRALEEARTHGDLSENAEYHAAKEQQGWTSALDLRTAGFCLTGVLPEAMQS